MNEKELLEHEADEKSISPETRNFVYTRDNYSCRRCGTEDSLNIHHILRRSRGGKHNPDNLILICWRHHRMIHDGKLDVKRIKGNWYFRRQR